MKKLYTLLTLAIGFTTVAIAQPTLTAANYVTAINDNQLYYIADTNSVINPTIGANVIFNYNGLRGYGMTQNQYIIDPTTTTYTGDFPSANYADTSTALATNIRYTELVSTDSLINLGFVANVPPYGDVIARYNYNPEIAMKFPFNYGDTYNDIYSGNFTIATQNTDGNGTVTVSADAWGQLQLPGGVVIDSVLRVRTVEYVVTDTITIVFPPVTIPPVTIDGESINYYKPSISKFPLLSYVGGSIKQGTTVVDSNKTFISQYPLFNVGVEELESSFIDMNLFPNPSNNGNVTLALEVEKNSEVKVILMNNLGQNVKTIFNGNANKGLNNINFNTENLSSGIYFVTTYINGSGVAKKFIIQ
ncbi:MAG: T9SS type A sorting domain-containing protein [Vicingaceae bacterium]|nr:T9SS type A sorting domain-containing protein [Vicingaceae bacterium]